MAKRSVLRLSGPMVAILVCAWGCTPRERVVAIQTDGSAGGQGGTAGSGGTGVFGTPFGATQEVAGLLGPGDLIQDPSLSTDELQIYFAAVKNGTYDIWTSTRAAVGQPWGPAVLVPELSSPSDDHEPDLSGNGLTIHLTSNRPSADPDFHIWVALRLSRTDRWGAPERLDLGASFSDRGLSADVRGLTLVLASHRAQGDLDLYLASRANVTAPWSVPAPLSEINSSAFDWDPGLFRDGLGLIFGSRRNQNGEIAHLFETFRPAEGRPFVDPRPIVELNSAMSEGDPWLSNDGRHIVFASDRTGVSRLYEAWR